MTFEKIPNLCDSLEWVNERIAAGQDPDEPGEVTITLNQEQLVTIWAALNATADGHAMLRMSYTFFLRHFSLRSSTRSAERLAELEAQAVKNAASIKAQIEGPEDVGHD